MIPVILTVGFLGSGKTTFLRQYIQQNHQRQIAYLINEFSALDIDGKLLGNETAHIFLLPGGSIFCQCLVTRFVETLRNLPAELTGRGHTLEGVVIEASGIANPKVIGKLLVESQLSQKYVLHSVIAIVDPCSFPKLRLTLPNLQNQIETANLILINKCDMANPEIIGQVEEQVRALNPQAQILRTIRCQMDTGQLAEMPYAQHSAGELTPRPDPHFARLHIQKTNLTWEELRSAVAAVAEYIFRLKGFIESPEGALYVDFSASGWQKYPAGQIPFSRAGLMLICEARSRTLVADHLRRQGFSFFL